MKFNADQWVSEHIRCLQSYSSARDEFTGQNMVYLDANENPYGEGLNRYPDPYQRKLREQISGMLGINPVQIFMGNGSDEAIDLLIRVSCRPGKDRVIMVVPAYGMYKVCAAVQGVEVDEVMLNDDFSLSASKVNAIANESHKLLFLCSPNNPSGNLLDSREIVNILNAFKGVVVVDEAYIDFSGGDGLISLLDDFDNLVLLRTFSKAWGLAGVRCGMALGHPEVIAYLMKIKYPYNLNSLTMESIREVIKNKEEVKRKIELIINEREKMMIELRSIDALLNVYHSDANFILIKVEEPDYLYDELIKRGLVIRNRSKEILCEGCLRITVGKPDENAQLISALKELLA